MGKTLLHVMVFDKQSVESRKERRKGEREVSRLLNLGKVSDPNCSNKSRSSP